MENSLIGEGENLTTSSGQPFHQSGCSTLHRIRTQVGMPHRNEGTRFPSQGPTKAPTLPEAPALIFSKIAP